MRETEERQCDADFTIIGRDVWCSYQSIVNIGEYRCAALRIGGSGNAAQFTKVRTVLSIKTINF